MDLFVDTSAICAVAGHRDAAHLVSLALHRLQHRGAAGAAVGVADGHQVRFRAVKGPVHAGFDAEALDAMPGALAIGQVFGRLESDERLNGDWPDIDRTVFARHRGGPLVTAVSGRFTNGDRLRRDLIDAGAVFQTLSDAELLLHLVASSAQKTLVNRLVDALWRVEGAYSLLVLSESHLIAVRDPSGFRPLVLGRLGDVSVLATEDGAIRFIGGEARREVHPGELLVLDGRGVQSVTPFVRRDPSACVQEYVSLARTDAAPFGLSAHAVRVALGERLAMLHPSPEAEVVCALPGGGESAALGFARASGLPYEPGLLAEPAVSRRLVEPPSGIPGFGARARWQVVPAVVADRIVVLVAPSVTTGRTLRTAIRLLHEGGARAVHLRIASPPLRTSCPYGVSGPMPEEMLFTDEDTDRTDAIGARSVAWLSLKDLHEIASAPSEEARGLCDACFSKRRPLEPERLEDQLPLF